MAAYWDLSISALIIGSLTTMHIQMYKQAMKTGKDIVNN
jgi:hypothetical protein